MSIVSFSVRLPSCRSQLCEELDGLCFAPSGKKKWHWKLLMWHHHDNTRLRWPKIMELKVWVEGIQRIVCGVTDKTTCQVRLTSIFSLLGLKRIWYTHCAKALIFIQKVKYMKNWQNSQFYEKEIKKTYEKVNFDFSPIIERRFLNVSS